ncbi:pyridoxamine 5'-phosphate oxidase family protein [Endozoicomonas lisbonensis]|uniref:Nitroimidazol reductase NimA-like FMN-containing flavoprotein (Pyridoxamine 5'-phosphate oxidase superfamily) n=1 Tax=Endozoicomonas lisbonensis TaxID=3120522 RepID=A0ABV2SJ45_9GAMM
MKALAETDKTKLKRGSKRACFDREQLYAIFDEAHVVHVGFVVDEQPYVIPTLGWRMGNQLYIHGSNGSRMIRALCSGVECCVSATLLDGMVLSKSAFHHSANYRSAVVFGRFREVKEVDYIESSLYCLLEHIAPGRWEEVRPPSEQELKATTILAIELEEASVKIRTGPAEEAPGDEALPVWSGEMRIRQQVSEMVADRNAEAFRTPDYSDAWGTRWEVKSS